MRKLLTFLLSFTALTAAAAAADLPSQKGPAAPAPAAGYDWSGVYGGLQLGAAFGSTAFSLPATAYSNKWQNNGAFGGAHLGYNLQNGPFVFGVEGEFNVLSDRASFSDAVAFAPVVYSAGAHHDWFGSADARLGYAVKNYLFYAVGGYAFTNNAGAIRSNGTKLATINNSLNGFDIGAGVEYAFTSKWSGRVEYRYYAYAKNTNAYTSAATLYSEKLTDSALRVGLSYHWDAAEAAAAPVVTKP